MVWTCEEEGQCIYWSKDGDKEGTTRQKAKWMNKDAIYRCGEGRHAARICFSGWCIHRTWSKEEACSKNKRNKRINM